MATALRPWQTIYISVRLYIYPLKKVLRCAINLACASGIIFVQIICMYNCAIQIPLSLFLYNCFLNQFYMFFPLLQVELDIHVQARSNHPTLGLGHPKILPLRVLNIYYFFMYSSTPQYNAVCLSNISNNKFLVKKLLIFSTPVSQTNIKVTSSYKPLRNH